MCVFLIKLIVILSDELAHLLVVVQDLQPLSLVQPAAVVIEHDRNLIAISDLELKRHDALLHLLVLLAKSLNLLTQSLQVIGSHSVSHDC